MDIVFHLIATDFDMVIGYTTFVLAPLHIPMVHLSLSTSFISICHFWYSGIILNVIVPHYDFC